MMFRLSVPTKRGSVLNGVLFRPEEKKNTDTVMIAITGIHGNFYSNPFYYNIGDTLNSGNIDFIYAQTNDAFGQIETVNINTGKKETIGSWNERFSYADEDIDAYLTWASEEGYGHIILAGHSLGANKVIYYLSHNHDSRVEHFFLLSPANLTYMMSGVSAREKQLIKNQVDRGDGDFSQAEKITHTGALLVGTYDNFTDGDPSDFLRNLNAHMPTSDQNKLIFIEKTGHTYQMKNQEVADDILRQLQEWRAT